MKNHIITLSFLLLSVRLFASTVESVPGEYLVKINSKGKNLKSLEVELGGEIIRELKDQNIIILRRPMVEQTEFALADLKKHPRVEVAEPNYLYRAIKTANEPEYQKLWGLHNFGQLDKVQTGIAGVDISAEKAWDITTGDENIIVAVIDTGIDLSHPDLVANLWKNELEAKGKVGVDDDGNGFIDDIDGMNFTDSQNPNTNPDDDNGHGTHCAGTIGAVGGNSLGVVGVNWKVKLMPVKFLGAAGGGTLEGAIRSIDYATKMGAHIASNSWGGSGSSQLLQEAIERSERAGVLFVAAAGNNGGNNDQVPHYPSNYPVGNIVSVAATDNRGDLAGFSNFGKTTVHIAAPGVNIFSTYKDGAYEWLSGTSMATPHVSGVAALLLGRHPQMTYQDLKEQILRTVQKTSNLRNKTISGGGLNAFNALTNTIPGPDVNDPFFWSKKEIQLSNKAHPYGPSIIEEYILEVPEAQEFSIYFDRFETENRFDKLAFFDRGNNLLFELTGNRDDSFGPVIKGKYVRMVLTSDTSVEKFGFTSGWVYFR